jgi:predicted MarR family transcription regulator
MMFNIEDTHIVAYALKKLEGLGLVAGGKRGKERTASVTPAGAETCRRYRDIREALLVDSVQRLNVDGGELSGIAALMRALSGQYDQAARAASSM